jgi:hypothetical protein
MAVVGMIHAVRDFSRWWARTPIGDALGFFRNGSYARLNQQVDGIVRMSGISTEPSSYAGYGSIWFVFLAECWLRRIEPYLTGLAALVLGTALLASASTTAYIALGAYGLLVATRSLIIPGAMPADRGLWLAVLGLTGVIAGSLFLLWQPSVADRLMAFGQHLLMDKMSSDSGIQRKFWAMQGLHAFVGTYGIGVGRAVSVIQPRDRRARMCGGRRVFGVVLPHHDRVQAAALVDVHSDGRRRARNGGRLRWRPYLWRS